MKWVVVHFMDEDSVEVVPETWYRKHDLTCAWPLNKQLVKRSIERRFIYPNNLEFQWLPARTLGRFYSNLEEANKALILSDLSTNEDDIVNNKKRKKSIFEKKMPSPLALNELPKRKNVKKKPNLFEISHGELVNNDYDSDKDPEYSLHQTLNNATIQKSTGSVTEDFHTSTSYIMSSPIGKILVETHPINDIINGRNNIENETIPERSTPEAITEKRMLFMSEPIKSNSAKTNKNNRENNFSNTATAEFMMPPSDFQKFVINTLTNIKYELTALNNHVQTSSMSLDTCIEHLHNISTTSAHNIHYNDQFNLDETFPITNEENLNSFENKIKIDNDFKSHLVSKLALLVGVKDVGDSIRRVMSTMFSDELLCAYSLHGFKKKKSFIKLGSYSILIDSLRLHSKYKSIVEKEFHGPLAVWMVHAKYRLANKNNNNIL